MGSVSRDQNPPRPEQRWARARTPHSTEWLEPERKNVMAKRSSSGGGPNRRNVTPSGDGNWAIHRPGATRASSVHRTQSEAIERARRSLASDGGGELTVHGRDG